MTDSEKTNGVGDGDFVPELPLLVTEEFQACSDHFLTKFNNRPDFFIRVPGRVNLIGEHIDYCGYSVCPMAIQQHILVAVRSSDDLRLTLTNLSDSYEDFECDISDFKIEVTSAPKWYQYFLCGVRGVLEKLAKPASTGMQAAVIGTIPPSSGLSSSSALVSAAILASARVFGLSVEKKALADLAASSERFIGTEGGGMDQAIAFLASEGCAKLISFNPLTGVDVKLPEGAVFVVANSLAEMNKAATADYNRRVVECRLVAYVLAKRMRLEWRRYPTLTKLQRAVGLGVRHFRALATETLHELPYTKKEICCELAVLEEEMVRTCLTENTKDLETFKLKQRLLHVAQEAERVQEFVRLCNECAKGTESRDGALWKLGKLMTKSHESLRDLYECSHEQLDKIVSLAEGNTLGARLTGAGWGGCTVALVTEDKVDAYITKLKETFYAENPMANGKDLNTVVFPTRPGSGAAIYIPEPSIN